MATVIPFPKPVLDAPEEVEDPLPVVIIAVLHSDGTNLATAIVNASGDEDCVDLLESVAAWIEAGCPEQE